MNIKQLNKKFCNKDKKREIGHYYASEIYSIEKGYLKPKDFFNNKAIDEESCQKIADGVAFEDYLEKMFVGLGIEHKYNPRYELRINKEITITCKPDFEFEDYVIETKFPHKSERYPDRNINEYLKESYQYQLEIEHRVTNKPVYIGKFVVPFDVKKIAFTPSKERFEKIKRLILQFHRDLKEYVKNNPL